MDTIAIAVVFSIVSYERQCSAVPLQHEVTLGLLIIICNNSHYQCIKRKKKYKNNQHPISNNNY